MEQITIIKFKEILTNILNGSSDKINQDNIEKFLLWFEANESYYFSDAPLMSDEQYEDLVTDIKTFSNEELLSYIDKSIFHIENDEVYFTLKEEGVTRTSEMVSLKKIKWEGLTTLNKINQFLNPNRKQLNLFYGIKFDGMAVKVIREGSNTLILTRGGQDITDMLINHRDIGTITRHITHGELVIRKSIFDEKYSDEYENPRNCILGVLKQNPDDLDFIECTDGISPMPHIIPVTQVWFNYHPTDLSQIYYNLKKEFQYQIDGIVIGYESDVQEIKDNYVLNMVAVKFKAESVKTTVVNINWTQKKSGNLTPVIEVKPIRLDGSTITFVSGYNYYNLKKNHIGIGSEVLITKSGDIIPVVEKVLTRSSNIKMPDVEYTISGKHLIASNNEDSRTYKFILGLKLLNIDGIGPTIADKIGSVIDYNIIELFNIDNKPKIIEVIGTGAVWNKFQQFYQTKNIGLDLLIELLQFDRCGKTLSKRFAEIILKINTDVSGIDKNVLNNVCRGEGFKLIKESMEQLHKYGIKVTKPIKISDDTISFEMSGNPPGMTKNDFIKKLNEKYPNSTHTTLTKDTKYLFVDNVNGTSSKLNKARKYNVKILSYQDALVQKL